MKLYEMLSKYQKGLNFTKTEDYYFYLANRHLLSGIEMYKFLLDVHNEFDVIRANIVIQALQNKAKLEKAILYAFKESNMKTDEVEKYIADEMINAPYVKENGIKIYVPVFSRAINSFYSSQFGKLLKEPYSKLLTSFNTSCIDLFELYNFSLYDSLFTKLIVTHKSEKVMAVYHYDFRTIYIINDQGRLDAKIPLFDKYMKHPSTNRIIERIKPVIENYLDDDKEGMFQAMIQNKLISQKLIYKIKHRDYRINRLLERKAKWTLNWYP